MRLLREALLTYELGDVLQRLLEFVTLPATTGHRSAMLVGPPGSGKSYLLKLLQALLSRAGQPLSQEHHKRLKELHATLGKRQYLSLEISPSVTTGSQLSHPTLEYLKHYLHHLATAEASGSPLSVAEAVETIRPSLQNLPPDTSVLVIIDNLESWLKPRDMKAGSRVVHMLKVLSAASQSLPLLALTNVNDRTLDSVNYGWLSGEQVVQIMGCCHLEYLSGNAIPALIGVHLLGKNARQRTTISKVREQLIKTLPELTLDEQEFVNIFPLHPAVWKIGACLRPYLEKFSFPAFAIKAADRIKNRPAESLFTVDEMLDVLEPSLRTSPQLAYAFQAYDKTIEAVLPRVSQGQRLHTRMLIKAILMHTLAGLPATVRDLTNSILFYDLTGQNQSYALAAAVLKQIKSLSKSLEAKGEDLNRQYRFALHKGQVLEERVESLARGMSDSDTAIGITLAAAGGKYFEDWPVENIPKGSLPWRACFTHIWNVTEQDAIGFVWQPASHAKKTSGKLTPIFSISLDFPQRAANVKSGPLKDIPTRKEKAFVHWVPRQLESEDIWTLKRLTALGDLLHRQGQPENDETRHLSDSLCEQAAAIFRKSYLERGTFQFRDGESGNVPTPTGEMPWSLSQWMLPLITPATPEVPEAAAEALTPEAAEWIGYLLAPDRSQVEHFRPLTFGEALGGLAGYYQSWQRRDVSRVLEQLGTAPPEATLIHDVLRAERQFEMAAFHIRYAIGQKSVNEEAEEIMFLFDSDPENFWTARQLMEHIYEFSTIAADYESKINYVRASVPTSDLHMEKLKYEMMSQSSSLWQFFDPQIRHRLDTLFAAYHPLYMQFYTKLHDQASDPSVIEPLCQGLVSGEEWNNLELISQLAIARQDFHVDAINQISLIYQMICSEPVEERLATHPVCVCGFHPDDAGRLSVAAERTRRYVKRGIEIHRDILRGRRQELRDKLKARKEGNADVIRTIACILESGDMPRLSEPVIQMLNEILTE